MNRPALLLACALSAVVLAPRAGADDRSLEAFLRKVRSEREAQLVRLRDPVTELARRFGTARSGAEIKKIHDELERLGTEVAPLLLSFLDPGATPTPEQEKCAQEVAAHLARSGSPALFEDLVGLTATGSQKGRVLAVRVLGASPDRERALAALRALYPNSVGELRAECVRSLARMDGTDPLVASAIQDADASVVRAALEALTDVRDDLRDLSGAHAEPLPAVLTLIRDPVRAAPVLEALVRYCSVPGTELDEDSVAALLRLAARGDLPIEARLAVLGGFPQFGVALTSKLRREVEPLLESSDSGLKDAALVALTLLKDGKAKRELLHIYDDVVKDNERWPKAYQDRGDIELKIGEYGDAARDYQKATELLGESARLPGNRDLWVNLARALIKDAKLKAAADALREFGLSSELRRTLKADPDFAPLVEHSKYKSLFE